VFLQSSPSNLAWIHFLFACFCFGRRLRYGDGLMALADGALGTVVCPSSMSTPQHRF
jgi:hypothetical protein